MIKLSNISKSFGDVKALNNVSLDIEDSTVFGLIGTNGAGKSTLIRILAGIYKQDEGEAQIDGETIYERPEVKSKFFLIPDEAYFFKNATPASIGDYYKTIYKNFDKERYTELLGRFSLEPKRKITTFSKGMKKQVSVIAAICSNVKYIYCDETFDGLDPVMRQAVKSLFAEEMDVRGLTPIMASHNLRELEDICDNIGYLHKGGVLLSSSLNDLKLGICKIQIVPREGCDIESAFSGYKIYKHEKRGTLSTLTVKGNQKDVEDIASALSPVFYEILPLSLEEIFITEAESNGYSIDKLIL